MDKARCNASAFANGCLSYLPVVHGSCVDVDNIATGREGEEYGAESRCFVASRSGRAVEGWCLRHRCRWGRLLVGVSPGQYEACDVEGDTVATTGASVTCPLAASLCGAVAAPNDDSDARRSRQTRSLQFAIADQTTSSSLYDLVSTSLEALIADLLDDPPLSDITVLSVTAGPDRVIAVVETSAASYATADGSTRLASLLAAIDSAVDSQLVYFNDRGGVRVVAAPYSAGDGDTSTASGSSMLVVVGVAVAIAALVVLAALLVIVTARRHRRRQSASFEQAPVARRPPPAMVHNDVALVARSSTVENDAALTVHASGLDVHAEWEEPPLSPELRRQYGTADAFDSSDSAGVIPIRWEEPPSLVLSKPIQGLSKVTTF
jgi:hypothetical protein